MSDADATPSEEKVIKRACTECRQQKAKCDAYLDPNQPCSRCQKMQRTCTISEPFKREHKRKRLSELEQQTGELRERLRATSHPGSAAPSRPSWAAINETRDLITNRENRMALEVPFPGQAANGPASFQTFAQVAADSLQTPESLPMDAQHISTLPRSIDGQQLDPRDIDALFQLYFRDYAALLPILDPSTTPNGYYNLSPFLFWAITGVACRTYTRNPTLLAILPSKIQVMALMSLNTPQVTLALVQGLLLLLQWPFPKSASGHDLMFPLSAAVLHMAMQIGLHIPVASQEFSKQRLNLTEEDLRIRAETWGYCTLIYQRFCWYKGHTATPMLDVPHDLEHRIEMFEKLSPSLKFELKLQDVVTRCCIAVSQNGLRTMTTDQERSLDTLLYIFQAQIANLRLDYTSERQLLLIRICEMAIRAFTLWKLPTGQDPTILYELSASCCQVLEAFETLDKAGHICLSASIGYFIYSLMPACHILLRLLKTSFSRYIDVERAKAALFLGISLHKRMSVQNDDVMARDGVVLTQLWNSTRAFKRSNGIEAVALRIRSRLTGSTVLDGIVWWREEFKGSTGVYALPLGGSRNGSSSKHVRLRLLIDRIEEASQSIVETTSNTSLLDANAPTPSMKTDYSRFMDDPMLSEFGWPEIDDIGSFMWTDGHIPTL